MSTKIKNIFDEIIKNLDSVNIESYENYKNFTLKIPKNYNSNKNYKGVNAFSLLLFNLANGYDFNCFLTFNQIKEYGEADIKGAKATKVKFFNQFYEEIKNKKNKITTEKYNSLSEVEQKKYFDRKIIKYSNVFNLQQIKNIEEMKFDFNKSNENENLDLLSAAEDFVFNLKNKKELNLFYSKVDNAKYSLTKDRVILPKYEDFKNEKSYYGTLFHELIHWSGSAKRLNRFNVNDLKEFDYNFEELVAEIGAILLMLHFEISDNIFNSIAYIKIYLQKFSEDEKLTVIDKAFTLSQQAVKYLTNE